MHRTAARTGSRLNPTLKLKRLAFLAKLPSAKVLGTDQKIAKDRKNRGPKLSDSVSSDLGRRMHHLRWGDEFSKPSTSVMKGLLRPDMASPGFMGAFGDLRFRDKTARYRFIGQLAIDLDRHFGPL